MKEYTQRVEFAAHLAWGLVFGFAGFYWHWGLWIAWAVFVIYDEMVSDKHYVLFTRWPWTVTAKQGNPWDWKDMLWDFASKLFGVAAFSIARL